jgi:hypothetical protein
VACLFACLFFHGVSLCSPGWPPNYNPLPHLLRAGIRAVHHNARFPSGILMKTAIWFRIYMEMQRSENSQDYLEEGKHLRFCLSRYWGTLQS